MIYSLFRRFVGFDYSRMGFHQIGSQFQVLLTISCLLASAGALAEDPTTNQLPNPQFRGTNGFIEDFEGTVNASTVPSLWRVFGITGADVTLNVVPLAENAIFPGSPATNAVRLKVDTFGADQGFDDSPVRFSLVPDRQYNTNVYLLSDNADNSAQGVDVGVAIFDETGTFVSGSGSSSVTATTTWTRFDGPQFSINGIRTAEMSFRLANDGGDNSILIALPEIAGPEVTNLMPNPDFEGSGGIRDGDVTGPVPDSWRGFAIGGGAIALASVPVAANELYPGSAPTNAVKLTVDTFGSDQGLDNELVRIQIVPADRSMWGEVYLRSGNADNSPQVVTMSLNVFDNTPAYLGSPGLLVATATSSWGYFGSVSYQNVNAATADLAFRLSESGSNNSVLIAMPRINGVPILVFEDGFE